jgi:hypothetical protein
VDKPNKPQTSDEEAAQAPPAPTLPARSPYRPLSRRRRQEQLVEPEAQVERPVTTTKFDASPTTIAAALAKTGTSPDEVTRLSWARTAPEETDEATEPGEGSA